MDPVTLEVIKGAVRSTRQEMASLVQRTSMSESIREKLDYFVAMFDRQSRMIYGTNLPLGANIIDAVVEEYPVETMKAGDLYWYNDCYGSRGGVSHSPDLVIIAPVFHGGELVAFSEAWGHLQDIGGLAPGSNSPFATEIYHEGTILPATRLERDGVRNDEMFSGFPAELPVSGDGEGGHSGSDRRRQAGRNAVLSRYAIDSVATWRWRGSKG